MAVRGGVWLLRYGGQKENIRRIRKIKAALHAKPGRSFLRPGYC